MLIMLKYLTLQIIYCQVEKVFEEKRLLFEKSFTHIIYCFIKKKFEKSLFLILQFHNKMNLKSFSVYTRKF